VPCLGNQNLLRIPDILPHGSQLRLNTTMRRIFLNPFVPVIWRAFLDYPDLPFVRRTFQTYFPLLSGGNFLTLFYLLSSGHFLTLFCLLSSGHFFNYILLVVGRISEHLSVLSVDVQTLVNVKGTFFKLVLTCCREDLV
jgi:hypothetical protein